MQVTRLAAAWVAISVALGAPQAAEVLSADEFHYKVSAALLDAFGEMGISDDGPGLVVTHLDGTLVEWPVNLKELYARYKNDPAQLDAILKDVSRREVPGAARAADRLIVVLRTETFVMDMGGGAVARDFAGDLKSVLAFDLGNVLEYATPATIEALGMSDKEAWAHAMRNVPAKLGPAVKAAPLGPGLEMIGHEGGHAPSALLASDLCSKPDAAFLAYLVMTRGIYILADRRQGTLFNPGGASILMFRDGLQRDEASMSRAVLYCKDGRLVANMQE